MQFDDEIDEQNARAVVRRYLRHAGALIAAMESASTDEQRHQMLTRAVNMARAAINGGERLRDVVGRRLAEKETLPPQADTPPLCGCVGVCRHRRY